MFEQFVSVLAQALFTVWTEVGFAISCMVVFPLIVVLGNNTFTWYKPTKPGTRPA
jgi:hypothetical protein